MTDDTFEKHMLEDAKFQDETRIVHEKLFKKMESLATKKDTAELKEVMTNFNTGLNIFKYTFNNGGKITGFLGLFVVVFLIFKYGFLGLIAFFIHTPTK